MRTQTTDTPRPRRRMWASLAAATVTAALCIPASPALAQAPAAHTDAAHTVAAATSVAAAAVTVAGYYRVPWASTIWELKSDGTTRELTFVQWQSAGSPKPKLAPIAYVKTAWADTVWAQVTWPAGDKNVDMVVALTAQMYRQAGTPAVKRVAHVAGSKYYRWASNGQEIFVRSPDTAKHKLTFAEWQAAGSPSPDTWNGGYYRARWSGDIHSVNSDGKVTKLSFAQWQNADSPTPGIAPTVYAKTPWAPTVYGLVSWPSSPDDRAVDMVTPLSWSQYQRAGGPRIEERTRIPGDSFVKYTVADTVFHNVGGVLTPLTGKQWTAAGNPAPSVKKAPTPTYIRGILIVNKSLPIPASFGNGLTRETSDAFSRMRASAARSGLDLRIVSGFRSYATQQSVHARYISTRGRAGAEAISARPGHSEHQTGMAIDVNSVSPAFANTPEGRWIAANAHKFGFIVRYPQGKEHITGYTYEPWHLRLVGVETATHLKRTGLTLEEYLGVPSRY